MKNDEEFATNPPAKTGTPSPCYTVEYPANRVTMPVDSSAATDCWVPAGRSVVVRRYEIAGGLIYFGESLSSASGDGFEPSLVNPSLKLGRNDSYSSKRLDYFPSYAFASEDARASYLNWLSKGRRDPSADIGYVYLYLYGLERRAFLDAQWDTAATTDIPAICVEVEALLSVYGSSDGSFAARAQSFLSFFAAPSLIDRPLYLESPQLFPLESPGGAFAHRLALSQAVRDRQPFPMDWWFSWLPHSLPRTKPYVSSFFRPLYDAKLFQAFPKGLAEEFEQKFASKLGIEHRLVYPGMGFQTVRANFDIADFTSDGGGAARALDAFGLTIAEALEPYTRLMSRSPHKAQTVEGMVLLPVVLWPEQTQERLIRIAAAVAGTGHNFEVTSLASLVEPMPLSEKLERSKYLSFLEKLAGEYGLGVEPDPRFGSPLPGWTDRLVLFDMREEGSSEATNAYLRKAAEVWFYSVAARAEGTADEMAISRADGFIDRMRRLTPPKRTRLRALLRVYLAEPVKITGMKKHIELLDEAAKSYIADNLVIMCQLTGGLHKVTNIRMLEKLFEALGQDTEGLYRMAHDSTTQASSDHPLPVTPSRTQAVPADFKLDRRKLAELRKETMEVSELLGAIFIEEPPIQSSLAEAPQPPLQKASASDNGAPFASPRPANKGNTSSFIGLDAAHSAFARELIVQPKWSRRAVEQMCQARGLMLEAALEKINDAAYDVAGDVLFEGGDDVVLNEHVAKELSV